jgi:uncharacterized damage-inducible protein DinB
MAKSDPLDILLTHNRWATRSILEACTNLTDEQFHQRFDLGPGSLHDTLTHILGAMRGWCDLLAGRDQRPRLEQDGPRTPQDLLELLEEVADELETAAHAHPVDEIVSGERGGRTYSFTRGGVLTHVTTHGMHHRAQCLNMLRQLEIDPLPPSAVVEWMFMVDPVT